MSKGKDPIAAHEIGNTYVSGRDRYVVSLVVGYSEEDLAECSPTEALAQALQLITDEGAAGTHWYVYDRQEKHLYQLEQGDADGCY